MASFSNPSNNFGANKFKNTSGPFKTTVDKLDEFTGFKNAETETVDFIKHNQILENIKEQQRIEQTIKAKKEEYQAQKEAMINFHKPFAAEKDRLDNLFFDKKPSSDTEVSGTDNMANNSDTSNVSKLSELQQKTGEKYNSVDSFFEQYHEHERQIEEAPSTAPGEQNATSSHQEKMDAMDEYVKKNITYEKNGETLHFNSVKEFEEYYKEMEGSSAYSKEGIKALDKKIQNVKYEVTQETKDYQNFDYKYKYDSNDKNPVSTFLNAKDIDEAIVENANPGVKELLEAGKTNPEVVKMFKYIEKTEGRESALKYAESMKEECNQIIGTNEGKEIIDSIKDSNGAAAELKVIMQGFGDGVTSFGEGVMGWFSDGTRTAEDYKKMYIVDKLTKEYPDIMLDSYNMSSAMGNMAPSIALSLALGPTAGAISMGVSAGGASYHQARVEGQELFNSILYGILSGCSEAAFERFLGAIPGIGNNVATKGLKSIIKAALSEGFEEGTQEFADAVLKRVLFGEEIDPETISKQMLQAAIYGAVTGGIMNAGYVSINAIASSLKTSNSAYMNSLLSDNNELMSKYLDEYENAPTIFNEETNKLKQYKGKLKQTTDKRLRTDLQNKINRCQRKIDRCNEIINLPQIIREQHNALVKKYGSNALSESQLAEILLTPPTERSKLPYLSKDSQLNKIQLENFKSNGNYKIGNVNINEGEYTGYKFVDGENASNGQVGGFVGSVDQLIEYGKTIKKNNPKISKEDFIRKLEEYTKVDEGYFDNTKLVLFHFDKGDIKIPDGSEHGAWANYWVPGGLTGSGDAYEMHTTIDDAGVINNNSKYDTLTIDDFYNSI